MTPKYQSFLLHDGRGPIDVAAGATGETDGKVATLINGAVCHRQTTDSEVGAEHGTQQKCFDFMVEFLHVIPHVLEICEQSVRFHISMRRE